MISSFSCEQDHHLNTCFLEMHSGTWVNNRCRLSLTHLLDWRTLSYELQLDWDIRLYIVFLVVLVVDLMFTQLFSALFISSVKCYHWFLIFISSHMSVINNLAFMADRKCNKSFSAHGNMSHFCANDKTHKKKALKHESSLRTTSTLRSTGPVHYPLWLPASILW